MKKQTAVEWYYQQTIVEAKTNYAELLEQAKAMEKEQHFQTFIAGGRSRDDFAKGLEFQTFPDYFDETFNSDTVKIELLNNITT